jgi:membrane protease YdiL (CAAX protease family)
VWFVLREPLRTGKASAQGLLLGAAFSVLVVGAGWLVFDRVLRDAAIFSSAAALIRDKIGGFGIDSIWKYAALAGFYSLFHALLEEYYWRWFVFGQLRRLVPLWPAIIVSALGFMGHHVIVLNEFFKDAPWLAWLLSSAVAGGGVFWAWLYERTASLFGPWLSHLLIDAGIFWVGYDLIREAIAR